MLVTKSPLTMPDLILTQRRCGEKHGNFYDRKGDYFREGVDPRNHVGRVILEDMDKYEKAAIEHDLNEIDRLKDYLKNVDPDGELRFAGGSVTDWAIHLISRKCDVNA